MYGTTYSTFYVGYYYIIIAYIKRGSQTDTEREMIWFAKPYIFLKFEMTSKTISRSI